MTGDWQAADAGALSWIESVANDLDQAGYGVGPMPDKIWVLHPLHERLDGLPILDGVQTLTVEEHGHTFEVDNPNAVEPPKRILRWREYARRRNIPMFSPPGYASLRDALPGVWHDNYVDPPEEGEITDSLTQRALFDILLRHTSDPHAGATAYYYDFWVGESETTGKQLPNVLHGPLQSWAELFDRPDYVMGPQNIWPDDHRWVVGTHVDSWATEISGPSDLIDDIIDAPDLETIRLSHPDLPPNAQIAD